MPIMKVGITSGSTFLGSPRTSSVISFVKPFPNNNYSIVVSGENVRTWTIQNKVSGSFVINSNSSATLSGSVFWHATSVGEFYS
jgi:hypothetical protein